MDIKNMQEYEQIYERAKKNSIGENKKCEEKRLKKKVAINISAAILTITLAFAAVAGCSIIKSINNTEPFSYSEPYDFIWYDYGYGFHDIHDFLTAKLDPSKDEPQDSHKFEEFEEKLSLLYNPQKYAEAIYNKEIGGQ